MSSIVPEGGMAVMETGTAGFASGRSCFGSIGQGLFGRVAPAVDSPGEIVIGGLECFQGGTTGIVNPLEAELAIAPFNYLVYDAAAALYAGVAKFLHCFFLPCLLW